MQHSLFIAAGTACLLFGWGCAQKHLTSTHGKSTDQAFHAQTVNPEAGKEEVAQRGLDPREASIVVDNYHSSLASSGSGGEDSEQILLISPPKSDRDSKLPPPSVPADQK